MYSDDLKRACVRLLHAVNSCRKVAGLLGTSASSVCRWLKSSIGERRCRKQRFSILRLDVVKDAVHVYLQSHPFATTHDVAAVISSTVGVTVSDELARLAIRKCGHSKKRPRFYQSPSHCEAATIKFLEQRETLMGRPIFPLDETGFSSNVRPTIGYSKRGERHHIKYKPTTAERRHTSVVALEIVLQQSERPFHAANVPFVPAVSGATRKCRIVARQCQFPPRQACPGIRDIQGLDVALHTTVLSMVQSNRKGLLTGESSIPKASMH